MLLRSTTAAILVLSLIGAAAGQEVTYTLLDVSRVKKLPNKTKAVSVEGERVLQWDVTSQRLDAVSFKLAINPQDYDRVRFSLSHPRRRM